MKVSYYPGCSLESTARDYADTIHSVCSSLDIQLEEIPDWNCCGATAAHSINRKASIELAGRDLKISGQMRNPNMLVPCPLCFNRLKTAEHSLKNDTSGRYEVKLNGAVPKIWDLANFFSTDEMLEKIKAGVKRPLEGLKVACYYGCMASRPPHITGATDFEDPQSIDRIVRALGGTTIDWPLKTDCCGASLIISKTDMTLKLLGKILDMAKRMGAQALVVSCQMCHTNLDAYQKRAEEACGKSFDLPVLYFTELMGLAWGLPESRSWLSKHFTDPHPVLRESGVLLQNGALAG